MNQFDELPEGWIKTTLKEIVLTIQYGYTASSREDRVGPRLLRITDLQNNSVDWNLVPFCECDDFEKYSLKKGDIVIARTGATTGKSFLLDHLPEETIFASYLIRLSTSELFPPNYISLFLQSPAYWDQITVVSKGTAQPGANAKILSGLDIPLPPLNEQWRIVKKIEALTARSRKAREALEAIPNLLDQFRQSVLAAAFRGDLTADWREQNPDVEPAKVLLERIRVERRKRWEETELEKMRAKGQEPKNDKWKEKYQEPGLIDLSELPELPPGWCWASAIQACDEIFLGLTSKVDYVNSGGVPLIRAGDINKGVLDFSKARYISTTQHESLTKYRKVKKGDVLVSKSGSLGTCAFVDTDQEFSIYESILVLQPSSILLSHFLLWLLRSPDVQRRMLGNTVGSTVGHLNLLTFRDMPIPIAPLEEQTVLLKRVNEMISTMEAVALKITECLSAELKQLDQSILAKAFRGELVPQDPNDEPAAVLLERIRAEREKVGKKSRRVKGAG